MPATWNADRRRSKHEPTSGTPQALARRLVDVLWALLRDNRTFTLSAPARVQAA
jgi:hypothetical protein